MADEARGKVIKPPLPKIESGKIFRPSFRLVGKEITNVSLAVAWFWSLGAGIWMFFAYIFLVIDDQVLTVWEYWNVYIPTYWPVVQWVAAGLIFVIAIPFYILYPLYWRNMEFSVISASGEAMPEVFVKKGLVNITKKHVPFRTITNISSRAGPLDRLFGIGTVEIETAGFSGANQQGPEEKIEGIIFYEELRDFILQELRKFRHPYATASEIIPGVDEPVEKPVPVIPDSLDDEILVTLRQIRDSMTPLAEILEMLKERKVGKEQ